MSIEQRLRRASDNGVQAINLFRTQTGGWQANVTHGGASGPWTVRTDGDAAVALNEALARYREPDDREADPAVARRKLTIALCNLINRMMED